MFTSLNLVEHVCVTYIVKVTKSLVYGYGLIFCLYIFLFLFEANLIFYLCTTLSERSHVKPNSILIEGIWTHIHVSTKILLLADSFLCGPYSVHVSTRHGMHYRSYIGLLSHLLSVRALQAHELIRIKVLAILPLFGNRCSLLWHVEGFW